MQKMNAKPGLMPMRWSLLHSSEELQVISLDNICMVDGS